MKKTCRNAFFRSFTGQHAKRLVEAIYRSDCVIVKSFQPFQHDNLSFFAIFAPEKQFKTKNCQFV